MLAKVEVFSCSVYGSINWSLPFLEGNLADLTKCKAHSPFDLAFLFLGVCFGETQMHKEEGPGMLTAAGAHAIKHYNQHEHCAPPPHPTSENK